MSYKKKNKVFQPPMKPKPTLTTPVTSLLDKMEDGREFESLVKYKTFNVDLGGELKRALKEISDIRKRPLVCYLANIVNSNIKASTAIDFNDDLPFSEMISSIPSDQKELDVLIVTPGGSAQQVAKFVDRLRPRFDNVNFIVPNMAMSAGTILVMSGDDIIMSPRAYIGPIDPQVPNKNGQFIPAQSILTLINDIQTRGEAFIKKGQNPPWTDLQILKQIDAKEIGNAINGSKYSIELVENYLLNYKFKTWTTHSDGRPVTAEEKKKRATEIAADLCDHGKWKTHSRGITREIAWDVCKIKITHTESIPDLDKAIRRFWALIYWAFENTTVFKIFLSDNYTILRHDRSLINNK